MQQTTPEPSGKTSNAGPLGAGLTMIAVVALFALGGRWLDEKLGSSPLFLLLGFSLGALGGFIHLVNSVAPELLPFRRQPPPTSPPDDEPDDSSAPGDESDPT